MPSDSPDGAAPGGRLIWWRSVRARITVAVVALASLAMVGAGVAAWLVEQQRIEQRVVAAINDELSEFDSMRTQGDPGTGEQFETVRRLTRVTMSRNSPDEYEILIGWWNDGPQLENSQDGLGERLSTDEGFRARVRELLAAGGGTADLDTSVGEIRMAVQPVGGDGTNGAFVVVHLTGAEQADFRETVEIYALVSVLALLVVTGGAWSVAGRLLAPVRELRATAQEITDTDLSRRIPVAGDDDISDLVRTVNAMLERLDDAFATQRTFLDDAGHELRTPVTVLRGHLELLDPYDHQEVTATRQLLLDEVDRMSRLVDDLILLAKAARPDFVHPTATDVGALTDQVFDKVRATAERDWLVEERATGEVDLDPQRITQALLQLTANAVSHTNDGTEVALGSRIDRSQLRLWVRDSGPGVPPAERERIFERFHRGNDHGSGDGSGLGLSIVRAIAEAHGGSARVDSLPGEGATFVLLLPSTRTRSTEEAWDA